MKLVQILSYMDLIVRVVIPFGLMVIFTLFLSYSILKSRSRFIVNFLNRKVTRTYYREIRLALSSIVFNLFYYAIGTWNKCISVFNNKIKVCLVSYQ